ncbi:AAA family ATPase [Nocardia sp. 2]|uniref:AAA family ATPase n=1 Tax=Nocardia acididurans TaxID=2802282 RepID=A0ABS1M466_9NOCA|nr:LuxR family transcriptional regulator [Nocardia acididurans]MBL1075452.1 AAA family ATPase [Nocardia acididurans]
MADQKFIGSAAGGADGAEAVLYGRSEELRRITALLETARRGGSGALALIGEPGEGKSVLLDQAAALVDPGWRVLRCAGVESESELPFAGLQSLLHPEMHRLDELPAPHAAALRCAFGLSGGGTTDRFAVGSAAVSLLAEVAAAGPVLCLIDDAQWLDRPSADALLFAAHRLEAESVVLLLTARTEFGTHAMASRRLAPLDEAQARTLLAERFPDLASEVRERVIAEAGGNPLAVLELPRMDPNRHPVGPLPLPERLCAGYRDHIAAQSEAARLALVTVAAEETGDPAVVRRALARLGLGADALAAAENSCMIVVSEQRVVFRHPLKRAAAYQLAPFTQRLAVHAALAETLTDDPDRRAWHLAFSTPTPDESVAAALESAARRATARAACGAAATAFERAAHLSPDRGDRTRRLIHAVEALVTAGRPDQALALADQLPPAADGPGTGDAGCARVRDLRAHIAFERGALATAHELWLTVAAESAVSQPDRAAAALLDAARAAWTRGDLAAAWTAHRRLSELVLDDSWAPLLDAVAGANQLYTKDLESGVALVRSGVAAARWSTDPTTRFLLGLLYSLTADTEDAHDLLAEVAAEYSARGMIGRLPAVHASLGTMHLLIGRFREAEAACLTAVRLAEGTGQPNRILQAESVLAVLAAVQGDTDRCRELADRQRRTAQPEVNTIDAAHCEWALLLLDLAFGRYENAVHRGEALLRSPHRPLGQWPHLLADRVEAALRLRDPARATGPLAALREFAAATRTPWVRGLLLRCEAHFEGDDDRFRQALRIQSGESRWFDHARTQLLYGEWLRRERRHLEARTHLESAARTLDRLGAHPWAARARGELRAAGGDSSSLPSDTGAIISVRARANHAGGQRATGARAVNPAAAQLTSYAPAGRPGQRATVPGAPGASLARPGADHPRPDPAGAAAHPIPAGVGNPAAGSPPGLDPLRLLTPQELQVVRLAARGATNNEIGAQLCLSPKTVGHHLYRAFPKLGVRSRVELARVVADGFR